MNLYFPSLLVMVVCLVTGCKKTLQDPMASGTMLNKKNASDPDKPETLLRMARAAKESGDRTIAIRFYRRILMKHPKLLEAQLELAELFLHDGMLHDARSLLDRAVPEDHPERLRLLGKMALVADQPQEALQFFAKLLKQQPDHTYALEGLGIAYDSLGQHAEAHTFYEKAIELPYTSQTLLSNYGLSLALGGKTTEGITLLKKRCQNKRATPRDRQNLGIAYALAGDLEQAMQWMSIDLDQDRVRQNLAYLKTLKTVQPADLQHMVAPEAGTSP